MRKDAERYELPIPDIARVEWRCPGCRDDQVVKVYKPRMTTFGWSCYCGARAIIDPTRVLEGK